MSGSSPAATSSETSAGCGNAAADEEQHACQDDDGKNQCRTGREDDARHPFPQRREDLRYRASDYHRPFTGGYRRGSEEEGAAVKRIGRFRKTGRDAVAGQGAQQGGVGGLVDLLGAQIRILAGRRGDDTSASADQYDVDILARPHVGQECENVVERAVDPRNSLELPVDDDGIGLFDDQFSLVDIGFGHDGGRRAKSIEQPLDAVVVEAGFHIDEWGEADLDGCFPIPEPVGQEASRRPKRPPNGRGFRRVQKCRVALVGVRFVAEIRPGEFGVGGQDLAGVFGRPHPMSEQPAGLGQRHHLGRQNGAGVAALDLQRHLFGQVAQGLLLLGAAEAGGQGGPRPVDDGADEDQRRWNDAEEQQLADQASARRQGGKIDHGAGPTPRSR